MPIKIISLVIFVFFSLFSRVLSADEFILPKNKPSIFKKLEKNILDKNVVLPSKKPSISNNVKKEEKKIVQKKEKVKIFEKNKNNIQLSFILPQKKPQTYRKIQAAKKSRYLNQKDFERAKRIFSLVKEKKYITAYKSSLKLKDKDLKKFVKWLYLMRSSNNASFNDYQMFIKKQPEYPRIGRLQYLAEQKIILKNTTPKNVINWFDQYPPVSGMGKLKLAEAFLKQNKTANIKDLIRE